MMGHQPVFAKTVLFPCLPIRSLTCKHCSRVKVVVCIVLLLSTGLCLPDRDTWSAGERRPLELLLCCSVGASS
jgi:hypothetical protein